MAISLGPTNTDEKKISLSTGAAPKYNSAYVNDIGFKYSVALGDISPGPETMANAVYTGTEDRYRHLLARDQAAKDENVRLGLIQELASINAGGNPTMEDIEIVKALSAPQLYDQNLPTILEQAYSKRATEATAAMIDEDTGVLTEAMEADQEQSLELLDRTEYATARNIILENKIQSVLSRSEFNDPTDIASHGWAWAQALVPFWQDFNIGNAVPDSNPDNFLVGDN
jgi:hypothetical protein